MGERLDRALDLIGDGSLALVQRSWWMRRWFAPMTSAVLVVLAFVAVLRMEASAADYDPQYMRVLVERTMAYGGSYYENGIHNKGPLEPAVYELAARLGGDGGFWFVIGVFTLLVSVCVGVASAVFAIRAGASIALGAAVAAMSVAHLTLSNADYSGVLYARNMTVALLSVGFVVAAHDAAWATRRRRIAAVATVGIATGLAVQTLFTACFTAIPVLIWAMWTRRRDRAWRWPAWIEMPTVSAVGLLSAPAYYAASGSWRPFVDGWWVYARWMSSGTGRSLGNQIGLGWDSLFDFYRERPALAGLVQVWLIVTALRWRQLDGAARALRLLAACWFAGAWIELVLSQRYSSHYFVVIAVPTMMMISTLVGDVGRRWPTDSKRWPVIALLPLLVTFATLKAGGLGPFAAGVDAASTITSIDDLVARRDATTEGHTNVVAASLDLVSVGGDPLLMWTSYPWPYLDYDRVSATRYIWKSFLLGEIYLGRSGPEYVLPGTWTRFAADLDRTDPTAFVVDAVTPVEPDTPFAARVEEDFEEVFDDGTVSLSYRNDIARWLSTPSASSQPFDLGPSTVVLAEAGCRRIDAVLDPRDLTGGPLVAEFGHASAGSQAASLSISSSADGVIITRSNRTGATGYARSSTVGSDPLAVSIIAGARSAVVVVDGEILGAVLVEPGSEVVLHDDAGALSEASRSTLPAFTGC